MEDIILKMACLIISLVTTCLIYGKLDDWYYKKESDKLDEWRYEKKNNVKDGDDR